SDRVSSGNDIVNHDHISSFDRSSDNIPTFAVALCLLAIKGATNTASNLKCYCNSQGYALVGWPKNDFVVVILLPFDLGHIGLGETRQCLSAFKQSGIEEIRRNSPTLQLAPLGNQLQSADFQSVRNQTL